MQHVQHILRVATPGPGLHEITPDVASLVANANVQIGLCTVFVRHTSASLLIQENADPSAKHDLEQWFQRIAPEHDAEYTHTHEGPDDMPSHLRSAVTRTSEVIPIRDGRLGLGTWQGLFLFEHRRRPHERTLIVHVAGA